MEALWTLAVFIAYHLPLGNTLRGATVTFRDDGKPAACHGFITERHVGEVYCWAFGIPSVKPSWPL